MVNHATRHYYRLFRAHQMSLANDGSGMITTYADSGKIEMSYGSAPYGEHALNAYRSAKRHLAFIDRLNNDDHH